jgi:hypothetical protein
VLFLTTFSSFFLIFSSIFSHSRSIPILFLYLLLFILLIVRLLFYSRNYSLRSRYDRGCPPPPAPPSMSGPPLPPSVPGPGKRLWLGVRPGAAAATIAIAVMAAVARHLARPWWWWRRRGSWTARRRGNACRCATIWCGPLFEDFCSSSAPPLPRPSWLCPVGALIMI